MAGAPSAFLTTLLAIVVLALPSIARPCGNINRALPFGRALSGYSDLNLINKLNLESNDQVKKSHFGKLAKEIRSCRSRVGGILLKSGDLMKALLSSLALAALALFAVAAVPTAVTAKAPVTRIVECSSTNGEYNYCQVPDLRSVTLVVELSRAPCVEGSSWQYDTHGIIVDHGCSARFATVSGGDASSGNDAGCHGSGCLVDNPDQPRQPVQNSDDTSRDGLERCSSAAVEKGWSLGRNPRVNRIIETYPDSDGYHVEGELLVTRPDGQFTSQFLCVWNGVKPVVLFGSGS